MKFFKYLIVALCLSQVVCFANLNDIYIADIEYDWINKDIVERQDMIDEVKDILFNGDNLTKLSNIKSDYKEYLKDKDYKNHFYAASAGYKEYKDFNISAFYFKNSKYIYMYALQDKKDLSKSYYYDALGNLQYIDFIDGDYPEYPYSSIQYRINGTPVSAVYFISKDTQYLFKPNGEFKGVWYKHNLYDGSAKIKLRRTTY